MSTEDQANKGASSSPEAGAPAAAAAPQETPVAEAAADHVQNTSNAAPAEDADEDAEDEGGAEEGADGAVKAEGAEGAKRKRKRRRKKKKPEGAAAAEGNGEAAQATGEGAQAAGKDGTKEGKGKKKRPKKDQPPRERPPFSLGDIVFGKVQDVTDDVLFVDLSGKAVGIFDLRELLIVESAPAAEEAEVATEASEVAADASEVAAEASEVAADAAETTESAESRRRIVPAAKLEEEGAEASAESESTDEASEPAPAEAAPQLPRVVLEPGAQFVGVVHNDGGRGGLVVLTHHPERVPAAKAMVSAAHKDGTLVYGIVTGVIKGGVEVDVDGLRAFAPASHMDLRIGADLHPLVGQRLPFAVTEYGKRGRDVVLSRRAILETVAQGRREEALKHLTEGQELDGVVRTVVPFGAFLDVGGIEGLVPLSEMSHNRADQPSDVFKVGDQVRVKLLRIDEKNKLWLSRRALLEDPWATVREKYKPGTKHTGKVARIHPMGVFVELEAGVDGLIRRGDLSFKPISDPSEIGVVEGAEIEVVVAHADGGAHRISLHPALQGEMANEAPQKVALHKGVKVKVVATEAGGLQVLVLGTTGWQARGYIPASATGTPRGTELRKEFPVGRELDAKVIDLDSRKGEVKLSIRAFHQDNERDAYNQYRAQVKREAKFGTFADLLSKHVTKGN